MGRCGGVEVGAGSGLATRVHHGGFMLMCGKTKSSFKSSSSVKLGRERNMVNCEKRAIWVSFMFTWKNRLPSIANSGGLEGEESVYSAEERVQSLGQADLLKKGKATHASILAWRIPWTKESGRLQVHRVAKSQT